jgi:hypothetical protein
VTSSARERWRRVQAVCERLEAVPSSSRLERLRALESDADIQREAIALLQAIEDEARACREHLPSHLAADPGGLPTEIGGVRIEARIGTGGSGDVYRGVRRTNSTEQIVAVKQFHAHRAGPDDVERFTREQRMLAALTHPAIVRFFDAGLSADGRPYLVMELAEGSPLVAHSDERRLGVRDRIALFLVVCDAVQSAHDRCILHLDLKPSNVIVTHDGHVKLVDFGTAKLADPALDLTRTEPLTVQYASPERLRGEPVSVACDVYSLGLILCELVSGGWPYARRESIVTVAERAAGTTPRIPLAELVTEDAAERRDTTPGRLRASLRGDLDAIAACALSHEPAARYASAAALAEDLRRYFAGEPTHAQAAGGRRAAARWTRRHRWALTMAGAALVVVAGAAAHAIARRLAAPTVGPPIHTFDGRSSMHFVNDPAPGPRMYDDFVAADAAPIVGATWMGTYCTPIADMPAPTPATVAFLVGIYADAHDKPDLSAPLHHAMYPIERTGETLDAAGQASCGGVMSTWTHYRYAVTLDRPVAPIAGTRYWFGVQAQLRRDPRGPSVYWGWRGWPRGNGSLQMQHDGTVARFGFDREFSLVRSN